MRIKTSHPKVVFFLYSKSFKTCNYDCHFECVKIKVVQLWMQVVKKVALTFYWYPKCGTCRKAKKWFEDHHLQVEDVHIVEHPPTKEQLKKMLDNSGLEVKKFFNTSGQKYRELGLKEKVATASEDELLEILASDGMLIKRPLTTDGKSVTVGFKEEQFEEMWLMK